MFNDKQEVNKKSTPYNTLQRFQTPRTRETYAIREVQPLGVVGNSLDGISGTGLDGAVGHPAVELIEESLSFQHGVVVAEQVVRLGGILTAVGYGHLVVTGTRTLALNHTGVEAFLVHLHGFSQRAGAWRTMENERR
jgi:hypothetical protein